MKYHKITREEHQKILESRHSVCPVPYYVIAEKLKIPERTVRRYANKLPDQARMKHHRASMFDPYKEEIEALLNKDMGKQSRKIKAALRDFRAAHPEMTVKKTAFYDFVRNKCDLTNEPRLARIPLDHDYGDAQIDFCDVKYYRRGRCVNGHQFTMTFVKSGVSFVQIFPAENQQCLFEAMRNIFEYIGFVPRNILFDNASTAVLIVGCKGKNAVPTKEYANFAAWYGFEYKFCNPASGWEKGAVEHANDTKRQAYFSPCPDIKDEREYNRELLKRCMDDAHEKHYLMGVQKSELFENEKKSGIALPNKPFDCRLTETHKTDKCALIWVKGCRYSVSDKHPRKNVIVRIGAFDVEIYELTGELICTHRRSYKQGSTTIDPTMYAEALAARPRARIKKSDNEYVDGESSDILHDIKMALKSVRPAAQADVLTEYCDKLNIACMTVQGKSKRAVILYNLNSYNSDKDHYDQIIQSNGVMVQTAQAGGAVCRGGTKQKVKRA